MSKELENQRKRKLNNDLSSQEDPTLNHQNRNQNFQQTKTSSLYDLYTSLYYPNGYTGSIKDIQKTLNTFNAYSLHKQKRKNFQRRRTFVPGPFHSVQADLIEYSNSKMAHANNNYRFILLIIDCFTKKIYARPMKSKKAIESAQAIDEILSSMPWSIAFFMRSVFKLML